ERPEEEGENGMRVWRRVGMESRERWMEGRGARTEDMRAQDGRGEEGVGKRGGGGVEIPDQAAGAAAERHAAGQQGRGGQVGGRGGRKLAADQASGSGSGRRSVLQEGRL